jgi:predicted AAA+ superfamily ATPase
MWIKRDISDKIIKAAQQFPALALTGARQTGKTSLLRELFPTYSYVTLEDPSLAALAEDDIDSFLGRYTLPIIIDEVQYAPKMFRRLKTVIDTDRHNMGRFLLTGSQKFSLMKELSESLAGRCVLLELESLSYHEIFNSKQIGNEQSAEALLPLSRGFYPELWRNRSADALLFYRSYLGTYLERDVRQILNVASLRDFDRFIRACALRSGQMLNKTELGKDVGIAQNTVNQWLSVLEASNQISLLEPFFTNKRKQLVKTPKLYFNDPGLLCFMLGLDQGSIESYAGIGQIWETMIFAELRKLHLCSMKSMHIWFYQESKKTEIDFLLETGGKIHAIEAKWSRDPDPAALRQLQAYKRECNDEIGSLWLASRSPIMRSTPDGITLVPAVKLANALRQALNL